MKILIPTYKQVEEVQSLVDEIHKSYPDHEVYASCAKDSASVNRNLCLDQLAIGEIAIMIDDDITGFYQGWVEDLVSPLFDIPGAVMVSARLLKQDGTFGPTCSGTYKSEPEIIEVDRKRWTTLPTAAISFVYCGYRFDENFKGSGWEDNDWCLKYRKESPCAKFIQSNRCKLVHLNQMKEQKGPNWHWNQKYFQSIWPCMPEREE